MKLRSKALPDQPGVKGNKALSPREKKRLLSQKQRDAINLGLRLDRLTPEKQEEKLTERVIKQKKLKLGQRLGTTKLGPKQKREHPEVWTASPEELAKEREAINDLLVWFASF